MYETVLIIHSTLRLVLVALCVWMFVSSLAGWFSGGIFGARDRRLGLIVTIVADVQLLVALGLYLVWSPVTKAAFSNMGASMKDPAVRLWLVEHPTMMLGAIVLLHVGNVLRKRLIADAAKYRWTVITTGVALLLILVGSPWPWSTQARPWLHL